jgi:hypothetical protein
MKLVVAMLVLAAGVAPAVSAYAAADNPAFPAAGLYAIEPLNTNDLPTGNKLAVICLVELGGGATKSFNNIWSIVSYEGFPVNPSNHISGNWGVSVGSPSIDTAVIMGNDLEISGSAPHPAVNIGNTLILDKQKSGKWLGWWIRWDNQGNNYATRVAPISTGTCTIPH